MEVKSLGYVVVGSTDLEKWRSYGTEVVGMMESPNMPENGSLYLKMDDRSFRYQIVSAEFDGLLFAGWDLGSESAFSAAIEELKAEGVDFDLITDEAQLAARSVSSLARLKDPSGNQLELYFSSVDNDGVVFTSPLDVKSFVTKAEDGSDMGLGHVVLHAPVNYEETHKFYEKMGFKDSDITDLSAEGTGNIYFMHCNPRHHSLALWNWGAPTPETNFAPSPESKAPGCVHLMAEVETLTEVGTCLDRVTAREIPIISSLGEHINDEMTSFYMLTPGNFALEFGQGGLQLEEGYETTHNTQASIWGHKWQG